MAKVISILIFINILYFAYGKKLVNNTIQQAVEELQAKSYFEMFIEKYEKNYETEDEYNRRFEIFKENLEKINKWNAESNNAVFGINQFADLNFEEFKERYTCFKFNNETVMEKIEYVPTGNAPAELDYRKQGLVTRIKNQGVCGSCYIFSAIGNIEGQYAKKHGHIVVLSEQQALDCDSYSSGCDGGNMANTVQALKEQGGSMAEADYTPYQEKKMQCHTDKNKITAKVTGGGLLNISSESEVVDALASIGPLSIGIAACEKFLSYHSKQIFREKCDERLNHGVVLVGYGSENGVDFWIIKNSWGESWGDQGYIRVEKGKDLIGVGKFVVSAKVA